MNNQLSYNLIRSNRKTIAIRVTKEGLVEVRAPLKAKQKTIDEFVILKEEWIKKNITKISQLKERRDTFSLNYGDDILLGGKLYPLVEGLGEMAGFDGHCFYVPKDLTGDEIRHLLVQIYKHIAKQFLVDRTMFYGEKIRLVPTSVKVNNAKTRWGSCSSKKSINLSWRLIMASEEIIDYVIIHELAHIREPNHSTKFWSVVESLLPDYKNRQKMLKEFQQKIAAENWE